MSIINKIEEIKEVMDLFLVEVLESRDNLVIDNEEEVVVFDTNINWNWNNDTLHIWDNENEISLAVNALTEDEDSLDRLYVGDLLLTVM